MMHSNKVSLKSIKERLRQINIEQKSCSGSTDKNSEKGFTLVELSLAITFLAFIMLFVVTMILQMINIYNKSVALSHMNQAGRQVLTDLGGTARFSSSADTSQLAKGRLCVGGVSYIWNIREGVNNWFAEEGATAPAQTKLRLVRVKDHNQVYCTAPNTMPSLNDENTNAVIGSNVWVQLFGVSVGGEGSSLLRVSIVLSTAGINKPEGTVSYDSSTGAVTNNLKCNTNDFCAFIPYSFVIYQRGTR